MKRVLVSISVTLLVFLFNDISAQRSKLTFSKEPGWITANDINFNQPNLEGEAENGYVDLLFEKQVSLVENEKYYKKVLKVLSESGVENNSEISIDYDPSYQNVVLHAVRIIREGISINKLDLSKFKTIQQETDLRAHLYNGTLTALLVLEDVRKGDIIEYSYTIKGFNPIFRNKYCGVFDTRFTVPVGNVYYKIVTPGSRKINIRNSDFKTSEKVHRTLNKIEYEWKIAGVKPIGWIKEHRPGSILLHPY